MKNITRILFASAVLLVGLTLVSCAQSHAPLETVPYVDLQKYTGTWYEIASFPQRFQKGCYCSKAEYKLHPEGYVEVYNSCLKDSSTGNLKDVTGKAFVTDKQTNAKLKVQFFWPFKGDYWIIDLAPDYSYAVVGESSRKYLWILSRSRNMSAEVYQQILARTARKGFDNSKLKLTDQSCK